MLVPSYTILSLFVHHAARFFFGLTCRGIMYIIRRDFAGSISIPMLIEFFFRLVRARAPIRGSCDYFRFRKPIAFGGSDAGV